MNPCTRVGMSTEELEDREVVAIILAAGHKNIGDRFQALAKALPHKMAMTYLIRGEETGNSITFAQMDTKARSIATYFQKMNAKGSRAVMLFESGIEVTYALLGCLYAGVIAAPMPAPGSATPDRYLVRIKNVLADGGAQFILTTSGIKDRLETIAMGMDGFRGAEWIAVDEVPEDTDDYIQQDIDEAAIAYLQYTSGSTSTPKGVMVTHRNLMKVVEYNGAISCCPAIGTRTVCWMPYFHDFGLLDGLLIPLAHGMSVYVMSPLDFVQNPIRWVNAIDRYRASHSSGPNFAFDLVARKSTAEERRRLDLSCWVRANNTAEPIHLSSISRFLDAFIPCGFPFQAMAPAYALAEATLSVTLSEGGVKYLSVNSAELGNNRIVLGSSRPETKTVVCCGKVWQGPWELDMQIVDPVTCELAPSGEVGEVWLSGDLVAKGYWKRPLETQEKFAAEIKGLSGVPYMRTGDLGFVHEEELVITGRRKDLIIVEGRNHYPQDIEETVESCHPCLRPGCTIAFAIEAEDRVRVVLVCEMSKGYSLTAGIIEHEADNTLLSIREIEGLMRKGVSEEHQLRVSEIVWLGVGLLPKTTSGKVERHGCKAKYVAGTLLEGVRRR